MAEITFVLSTEHNNYDNITVYDRLVDGETGFGWRINANEGYVFYDSSANNTELDLITGEEVPVTYYYTLAYLPRNYRWENFPYIAVPRDSVDENYIFGGGNTGNDHVTA